MIPALATIFAFSIAFAADPEWPSFRGPSSNPAVANSNLPEKWSKSENVEWTTDIPGLGWSSPIARGTSAFPTPLITDGKAKRCYRRCGLPMDQETKQRKNVLLKRGKEWHA